MPPTWKIFEVQNRNNIHTGNVVGGFHWISEALIGIIVHADTEEPGEDPNKLVITTTKNKRSLLSLVYLQRKCHNFSCFAAFRFSEESASAPPHARQIPSYIQRRSWTITPHTHTQRCLPSRGAAALGQYRAVDQELLLQPRSFTKNRALLV